jgi:trk system potassium uptake protein
MFLRVGIEDIKVSLKDTGTILMYSGLVFFVPIIMSILFDRDPQTLLAYSASALMILMIGYGMRTLIITKKETEIKHAMLSIVLIWLLFCLFASLPFVFILKVSLLDAFFETMSTLTTTGLSVMTPLLDSMPPSLIFWRTFLGWVGGIGIVLMAFIGLMATYSKTSKLLMAEGRGEQLKENLRGSAKKIISIYVILTIVGIILLLLAGQNAWQATNYSMSAISTNGMDISETGLMNVNNGWAPVGLHNYWVDLALIVIMIFGAMSFALHYVWMKKRDFGIVIRDPEFRALIFIGGIGALIVGIKLGAMEGLFHAFSAITCGGFSFIPPLGVSGWDDFIKIILIPLMIIGGAAGSTAGGIKLSRFIIFVKSLYWKIKSSVLPEKAYFRRRYNGETVTDKQVKDISLFILLWFVFLLIGTVVLAAYGNDLGNSFFEVSSAQSNAGISTGIAHATMPWGIEIMLIINMFVGRLEIIPLLASIGILLSIKDRKRKRR